MIHFLVRLAAIKLAGLAVLAAVLVVWYLGCTLLNSQGAIERVRAIKTALDAELLEERDGVKHLLG